MLPVEKLIDDACKPVKMYDGFVPEPNGLPYITHEGLLKIGDASLRCYVLSNGQRIFDKRDVEAFFPIVWETIKDL